MDIEDILMNWARWVRVRQVQGHCASIEHRYRMKSRADSTPTGWGDWLITPPSRPALPVDALSALAVERVMRLVPRGHRKALKLCYVFNMPNKLICLRLVIRLADWDRFLVDARCMVANLLLQQQKKGRINIRKS